MSSRRDALSTINLNVGEKPNAGLWLDKFISSLSKEDKESHSNLAKQVAQIDEPDDYVALYDSWKDALEELGAVCRKAEVKNRMAVGLGCDGVLETSVMLHRTYGVPYIPGSAMKGLAAAFARQYCGADWQVGKPFYEIVFGTNDKAGYVTFFDALYVHGSGHHGKALHFDVMTVHHRAYYEGKNQPPADWDDPNPVPFVSATGKYLIALAAPDGCEGWREIAFKILKAALGNEGIGGKTSSGYGRMTAEELPPDSEQQETEGMIRAIKAIPDGKLPNELGGHASKLLSSKLIAGNKHKVAQFVFKRINDGGSKRRKKFEEKPWFAEVQKLARNEE